MIILKRLASLLIAALLLGSNLVQPASAQTSVLGNHLVHSHKAKSSVLGNGLVHSASAKTSTRIVEIKGEVIDTWCYFSGVMGDTDATRGTAHHTCALWCAAGGIPVGVRTQSGQVYMVLKYQGEDALTPTDTIMEVQSDIITARGQHFIRDGVNYLVVEKVVANDGIQYMSHEDYDSVPPFSAPKRNKE